MSNKSNIRHRIVPESFLGFVYSLRAIHIFGKDSGNFNYNGDFIKVQNLGQSAGAHHSKIFIK